MCKGSSPPRGQGREEQLGRVSGANGWTDGRPAGGSKAGGLVPPGAPPFVDLSPGSRLLCGDQSCDQSQD